MRVLIIANPIAGRGGGAAAAEALYRELSRRDVLVDRVITRRAGDAFTRAQTPGLDCVAVVGGDGTVNEVVNGLKGLAAQLAIFPVGTANVVAWELGVPPEAGAVADLIVGGVGRVIDAGRVGSRRFLLGAGAGLDAAVVERVHRLRGKRLSYLSYVRPVLAVVCARSYAKLTVTVDGARISEGAEYAVIGNCRCSAGVLAVTPQARLDDGLLDVCCVRDLGLARLARLALATRRKGFSERRDLTYVQGREVTLAPAGADRVAFQVDGDPAGELPVTVTVEPGAVRVAAP